MRAFLLLLALLVIGGMGFAGWQFFGLTAKPLVQAQQRAGEATVDAGAAQAALDAERIFQAGRDRDRTIIQTTKVIREHILSAQGADAPVSPDVIRATNDGLRQLAARDDDPR